MDTSGFKFVSHFQKRFVSSTKKKTIFFYFEICERLGWKGKGTRFDLLPLVLQAHGEDPDLYELPQDIILEVELRHPQ